jgi:hypothetical protein
MVFPQILAFEKQPLSVSVTVALEPEQESSTADSPNAPHNREYKLQATVG